MPEANVVPFINVPSFSPMISRAFPSPGHQLTKPGGGGRQPVPVCDIPLTGHVNSRQKIETKTIGVPVFSLTIDPLFFDFHWFCKANISKPNRTDYILQEQGMLI
jgi:hypothetical protein